MPQKGVAKDRTLRVLMKQPNHFAGHGQAVHGNSNTPGVCVFQRINGSQIASTSFSVGGKKNGTGGKNLSPYSAFRSARFQNSAPPRQTGTLCCNDFFILTGSPPRDHGPGIFDAFKGAYPMAAAAVRIK